MRFYSNHFTSPRACHAALLIVGVFSCGGGQQFSTFPGFSEHFRKHPPTDNAPSTQEVELLERYKPRIYKAVGQPGPIDFYKDYISAGTLFVDGKKISDEVTQKILNLHRDNPNALFKYHGEHKKSGTAKVYARIDYEQTQHGNEKHEFTFLTYNLVFPVSGIVKGIGRLKSVGLSIVGNLDDWHQLDHYVNVSVALLDSKAVAMTLQQHNYQTTYLLDSQEPNIAVDIAMRSNELYPHSDKMQKHPAVQFLTKDNLEFMINNTNKPVLAGYDTTHGEEELNYHLVFLHQTDAFYQFKGSLGKSRSISGRSGPPGADYATLPGLMPRHMRLVAGFRTDSVQEEIALYDKLFDRDNFLIRPDAIEAYKDRFFKALRCYAKKRRITFVQTTKKSPESMK